MSEYTWRNVRLDGTVQDLMVDGVLAGTVSKHGTAQDLMTDGVLERYFFCLYQPVREVDKIQFRKTFAEAKAALISLYEERAR